MNTIRIRSPWAVPVALALVGWAPAARPSNVFPARVVQRSAPFAAVRAAPRLARPAATGSTPDTTANGYPYVPLTGTAQVTGARGRVELLPVASPFGVAVTADGSQRYRARYVVHGLPGPSTLGPYSVYVVWAASWFLEDAERLGVVTTSEGDLAEVHWNKFRILITAESSANVSKPTGPVVLRGISPSGRIRPNEMCNLGFLGPC